MEPSKSAKRALRITGIIFIIAPIAIVVWLLNKNFVPFGSMMVVYRVGDQESPLVQNFASKEKDELIGSAKGTMDYFRYITQEPVYFDVKVPRVFPKATVTLKYQNPSGQNNIILGVTQKGGDNYFKNLGVYNSTLENLPGYWKKIREDNLVLYQRDDEAMVLDQEINKLEEQIQTEEEKEGGLNSGEISRLKAELSTLNDRLDEPENGATSSSIKEFLNRIPNHAKVLRSNIDLSPYLKIPDYQSSQEITTIDSSIRGEHEIYAYLENEPLDFKFFIQDINRHSGADDFAIDVFKGEEKVESIEVADDGNSSANGKPSVQKEVQLSIPKPANGLYRIRLGIKNDEIFIRKIETKQHLIVFADFLYLTDNNEYRGAFPDLVERPTTIYSNGNSFQVRTAHANGFQTVKIGGAEVKIDQLHKEYSVETGGAGKIQEIVSPKNDIFIRGNGFFSFEPEQYFDPYFGISELSVIMKQSDIDKYDYIIADYPEALHEGNWEVVSQTVEVPYLYTENNTVRFMVHLPGLVENNRIFKINEVSVKFEKDPITFSNLLPRFKSFLKKIF
ncbi:MAG: hypothetical protein PHI73_02280 [Patescibacteria group bacterium]|nr:hypothetical protein [Patescibacteria group bacterium]